MSWLITPQLKSLDGVPVGTLYGGGYVAGFISHTADGVPTHALIVAPRATGASGTGYPITTNYQWKNTNTATAGTSSTFNGVANTISIVDSGVQNHPAAQFCTNLTIGGYSDWYLPSILELDIAYANLKPTATINNSGGTNIYSVPRRDAAYTTLRPSQTGLVDWQSGAGAQAFSANYHWSSSTQGGLYQSLGIDFSNGLRFSDISTGNFNRVRAFRRIAL